MRHATCAKAADVSATKATGMSPAEAADVTSAKPTRMTSAEAAYVASAKAAHVASTTAAMSTTTAAATTGLCARGKQAAGKHCTCQNHHHSSSHDILLLESAGLPPRDLVRRWRVPKADANVAMEWRWR